MAGSVHDQAHLAGLFDAGDVARLFTASAEIRAMLVVEGTLAKTQGTTGVIPELSAAAIHRASLEIQIDPGALCAATALNGVSVPALVAQFREEMQAPEHAQFVHWGATSQDIIDTGLMLRLRQAVALITEDVGRTLTDLADLAETHATTPMIARTYAQHAAPTSFGAVVASWGYPLLEAHKHLTSLTFPASLSGAVGTGSALGNDPAGLRSSFADALRLTDPERSWHTDRMPVLNIVAAATNVATALGKLGEDVVSMAQSDVGELRLGAAGASSTMPQKQNPVTPSVLLAIARVLQGFETTLKGAAMHRFQRDGAAWFTEWMIVPQVMLGAATAARHSATLVSQIEPDTGRMMQALSGDGLIFSEALSFALAAQMPRADAQAAVKDLAREVRVSRTPLPDLAHARWPDLPRTLFDPTHALGTAPADARAFVKAVRT
ncbi:MAG: lyase family protein [Aliishimia sp.]